MDFDLQSAGEQRGLVKEVPVEARLLQREFQVQYPFARASSEKPSLETPPCQNGVQQQSEDQEPYRRAHHHRQSTGVH